MTDYKASLSGFQELIFCSRWTLEEERQDHRDVRRGKDCSSGRTHVLKLAALHISAKLQSFQNVSRHKEAQNAYVCVRFLPGVFSDHRQSLQLAVFFQLFSSFCKTLLIFPNSVQQLLVCHADTVWQGDQSSHSFIFLCWWLTNNKAQWCYSRIEQGCSLLPFVQSYLGSRLLASHLKRSSPRTLLVYADRETDKIKQKQLKREALLSLTLHMCHVERNHSERSKINRQ